MKRIVCLIAVIPVLLMSGAVSASAGSWKAVSLYGNTIGYGEGNYEHEARANAQFQCHLKVGNDANCSHGTSVENHWTLIGVRCWDDGVSWNFTAGSKHGRKQATSNVIQKVQSAGLSPHGCDIVGFR